MDDELIAELAAEAEAGYDPDRLIPRPLPPSDRFSERIRALIDAASPPDPETAARLWSLLPPVKLPETQAT